MLRGALGVALGIVLVWTVYQLREILVTLLLAGLLAVVLEPVMRALLRLVPARTAAAFLTVAAFLITVVAVVILAARPAAVGARALLATLPTHMQAVTRAVEHVEARLLPGGQGPGSDTARALQAGVGALVERTLEASLARGARAYTLALIPVLVFYLLKDSAALRVALTASVPAAARIVERGPELTRAIRRYLTGLVVVAAVAFVILWIGLRLLGMPSALGWAALVAVAETVPYLGPLFALVTLGVAAFVQGTWTGVAVVVLLLAVRVLIDTIVSPQVLGGMLRLHPVVVIVAILAGAELLGVVGVFLAAPVVGVAWVAVTNARTVLPVASTAAEVDARSR